MMAAHEGMGLVDSGVLKLMDVQAPMDENAGLKPETLAKFAALERVPDLREEQPTPVQRLAQAARRSVARAGRHMVYLSRVLLAHLPWYRQPFVLWLAGAVGVLTLALVTAAVALLLFRR